jgi:hypothetical protein
MDVRATCLTIVLFVAAPASAGVVRGVVHVPSVSSDAGAALNAYPGRASSLPGSHGPHRGLVTDAVVFVERLPAAADSLIPPPARRPRLAQKDQCFMPRVVPIAMGTTVDFPNLDPIYHNVFSPSPLKRFDLGKYPRGESRAVTFNRPAVVNVFCDIHSDMEAFVLVLPHHAFTQPDADGHYVLPALPPGRYVLRAWHPDLQEIRREIDVPEGDDLQVDLSF